MGGELRPATVICSGGTLVLSLFSVWFLLSAFTQYRAEDFRIATETPDMASLGTCVEAPSLKIAKDAGYQKSSWDCSDEKNQARFSNLLAVSVHALWWAKSQAGADSNLEAVADAVAESTMGSTGAASINASMFVAAVTVTDTMSAPASCDALYPGATWDATMTRDTPAQPIVSCGGSTAATVVTTVDANKLYTHCLLQFSFGRSGPDDGTYGVPKVGAGAGPSMWIWPNVTGYNESASWSTHSRMYLGARYSWSLAAYVTIIIVVGFCILDSAVLLLSELTWPERSADVEALLGPGSKSTITTWKRLLATHRAKRDRRTLVLGILILNALVAYAGTVLAPWGIASRLGRPVCEAGDDGDQLWRDLFGSPSGRGGWETDWSAYILEVIVLAGTIFTLIALPLAEILPFPTLRTGGGGAIEGAKDEGTVTAKTDARANWTGWLLLCAAVGTIVLSLAHAWTSTAYGSAWAEAVAVEDRITPNSQVVSEYLFDVSISWLVSLLTAGAVMAAIQSRWTINGLSCNTLLVFGLWVLFALGAFLPMIIVVNISYFTDRNAAVEKCTMFDNEGWFQRLACDIKWVGILVGTALLVIPVMIQTVVGGLAYCNGFTRSESSAKINVSQIPEPTEYALADDQDYEFRKLLPHPSSKLPPWRLPIVRYADR